MADNSAYPKLAQLRTPAAFLARCRQLECRIPCDPAILTATAGSPMAQPIDVFGRKLGNRWCVQPMEGWDGTREGEASDWTRRRWHRFGLSGAGLIWGGEAVAVRHDGRANPNQLVINERTLQSLAELRELAIRGYRETTASSHDPVIGLQLTHSGRFCRPDDQRLKPLIAYHHPLLDARFGISPTDDSVLLSDDDLRRLIDDFVTAAGLAERAGFDFVDLKCCHGYLGHELLSAFVRTGPFGGSFENRTRFIRELIARVREACPVLRIGVRLSAFDLVPFEDDHSTARGNRKGAGRPMRFEHCLPYCYGFGVDQRDPTRFELTEPVALLHEFRRLGVAAVNVTGGSPYYNPHIQRPAYYPPSDGYEPPEDPLIGVARQIDVAKRLHAEAAGLVLVGTGYSYLQEFMPLVAQAVVREGWIDLVGIGRVVLSYPKLPHDTLQVGRMESKLLCRTFSDCTTGPRNGLISGCFPLDEAYKRAEAGSRLREIKRQQGHD